MRISIKRNPNDTECAVLFSNLLDPDNCMVVLRQRRLYLDHHCFGCINNLQDMAELEVSNCNIVTIIQVQMKKKFIK